jgi:hypothetical protein
MSGIAQQHFAFDQRLANQAEFVIFEVAQPPMDQLGADRRCGARKIALLDKQHAEATPHPVARDAGAVDTTADDQEIDWLITDALDE